MNKKMQEIKILDYIEVVEKDIMRSSRGLQMHVVENGDSFYGLGEKYGMPWKVIFDFNKVFRPNLEPNVLFPGDIIYIPTKTDLEKE